MILSRIILNDSAANYATHITAAIQCGLLLCAGNIDLIVHVHKDQETQFKNHPSVDSLNYKLC